MKSLVGVIFILAIGSFMAVFYIGKAIGKSQERSLLKDYQISVDSTAITVYDRDRLVSVCNWDSCELSRIIERDNQ